MYAIVTTGGKQFKVTEGDVFRVEKLETPVGDIVELRTNMLVKDDGIVVDPQALADSKVLCHVVSQGKLKKIKVYKRKRKNNYNRTYGHRQLYTEIQVTEIVG
jgi:large subunit ribosomal protein L21